MRAADYLGADGPLAAAISGYEHRPSQLDMADAVERALDRDGVLLVEAGTGTGKTLAYLVPALLSERTVVISTGTRTLQDQIMEHDLPLIERHLGLAPQATCMKGLGNYLCLRRFEEFRQSADAAEGDLARELAEIERWRKITETGDRAEIEGLAEDAPIWSHVASSSETRIGSRCPYYEQCFVTNVRRRAEEAKLIVVNHHLFFADLATRGPHGRGIIPDYDAVVFDEAHQVEDVVTQFFGVQVSTTRLERLTRDARRSFVSAASKSPAKSRAEPETERLLDMVQRASRRLFTALPRDEGSEGSGRQPLAPETFDGELAHALYGLDNALDGLGAHCRRRADEAEAVAQIARRTQQIRDDLAAISEGGDGDRVAWTERRGKSTSMGASPVDVSAILREELLFRVPSLVFTSATLSTGGHFDFIKRRLGIDENTEERILPSPFDYQAQAALYVPRHVPDPREADFMQAAEDELVRLVRLTEGGAFVLCTSVQRMHDLATRCRPKLADYPIWTQGDAPKGTLLERFRESGRGVLFATATFWEGVDVPGDALRLVIIDRLPFGVPTDPLIAARCDRIREQGEQPFMKYLVPSASLSLKQGFGRLVRGRGDRGIVALLDSRVVRKGYGKIFLSSLPPARRCDTFAEVEAFWQATSTSEATTGVPVTAS